jgi:hypothetical protein
MAPTAEALPYAEVLRPRWWVWLLPLTFAGLLGIAYGAAYGATTGWLAGAATAALLLPALALGTRTRITVDPGGVRAGRARLPARYIGEVRCLDREQAFRARTSAADPRAYLVLRTWSTTTAVALEVTDPEDPHPYWLVSTRRPQRLADALVAARAAPQSG